MPNIKNFILLIVLLCSFTAYSQSNINCPDCSTIQNTYDSIHSIYKNQNSQLKKTQLAINNAEENKKDLTTLNQSLSSLQEKIASIKTLRNDAILHLENCLSDANPSECKKCQEGKELNDDGAHCDDGDPCTINDRCVNGICIGDPVTSSENAKCGEVKRK